MNTQNNLKPMNILLAVDGSEHAFEATRLVKELPCYSDCHLTAMMVIIPKLTSFNYYIDTVLGRTKEILTTEGGPTVETLKVFSANPGKMINDYAREQKIDLIVLGARGLRATLGILLGGVAQQVVEYSCCPVLVVRRPYGGLKKIIFATDGSTESINARNFLKRFHFPKESKVEICHVLPPLLSADEVTQTLERYVEPAMIDYPPNVLEEINQQLELDRSVGERVLLEAEQDLSSAGVPLSGTRLLNGDAATEILRHAEDGQYDLIVAGSRGMSSVEGWWIGSVSRKLVHYAPCSVLIVK